MALAPPTDHQPNKPARSIPDAVWAAGVGALAMAMYYMTLTPGLGGLVDAPKFQFIGAILGVPHPPGYPL